MIISIRDFFPAFALYFYDLKIKIDKNVKYIIS